MKLLLAFAMLTTVAEAQFQYGPEGQVYQRSGDLLIDVGNGGVGVDVGGNHRMDTRSGRVQQTTGHDDWYERRRAENYQPRYQYHYYYEWYAPGYDRYGRRVYR